MGLLTSFVWNGAIILMSSFTSLVVHGSNSHDLLGHFSIELVARQKQY